MCGVLVPRGGVCATWVCAWRQRQRPGDPARQRTTQCVCVRVCVCVCVCGRPCVCGGGMHVVCGQRHRHRITQPGKGQHCVRARACVYVCVHTRMCVAWAGCLCVGYLYSFLSSIRSFLKILTSSFKVLFNKRKFHIAL